MPKSLAVALAVAVLSTPAVAQGSLPGVSGATPVGTVLNTATSLATGGAAAQAEKDAEARAATFGLGAIMGVAAYNMITTAASAGLSAATGSALGVAGAVGASTAIVWVRNTYNGERTEMKQLLPVGVGALAGVAAGDVLASGVVGYSPFAAAAGGFMPNFGFSLAGMASGFYAYTTGVIGARVADATVGVQPKPQN